MSGVGVGVRVVTPGPSEKGRRLALISREVAAWPGPIVLPSLLSGSTFRFLESSHLPSSGPLLSTPTQDLDTKGVRNIEPQPRLADKKCPLYLPKSKSHIPGLGGSSSGRHPAEMLAGAQRNPSKVIWHRNAVVVKGWQQSVCPAVWNWRCQLRHIGRQSAR